MASATPNSPRNFVAAGIESIGARVTAMVEDLGSIVSLFINIVVSGVRPPYRWNNLFSQLDFVGVGSLLISSLTGIFSGMVFAHQSARAFEMFNAQSLVGPTVALTVTRELAPVFSALMVTMRAGSAMCTELGTMRVTEQVDALETMAVNPVQYLLLPRVIAGLIMVPLLVIVFDLMGISGAYLVSVMIKGVSAGTFITRTRQWLDFDDLAEGIIKGAVFGFTVALIACHRGYNAKGGAKGVGQATTQAMVQSALSIFVLDYIVGVLLH